MQHFKQVLLSPISVFKNFQIQYLRDDVLAGLTVSALLVPQAVAYAMLAGLPAHMGLYAALFGVFFGSLWGSSSHVSTGPVAIVSLLSLTSLLAFADPGSPEFITLSIMLALLVGLFQFTFGFFKLGFLTRLIPHTVLTGFSVSAAIIIALSQVPALLGFSIASKEFTFETIWQIVISLISTKPLVAGMGLVSIVFLILFKKHFASLPGALLLVVVGITASYLLNFQDMSIPVVGVLPNILPNLVLPNLDLNIIKSLVLSAFVISIVGFMETFAVAKTIAAKTKEKIDADQEFMGQGLSNIFSGLFGGYTVAGSFSRSAVNFSAGAKTKVAGLVVAIVLVFSILFLTPLLYYLPKTILAAIVIVAVIPLIKFDTLKHIFHISRIDGMVAGVTFVFAFLLKPDEAVFIGMLLALFIFIRQVMFPQVSELGFDTEYNDILRRAGTKESIKTVPSVLVLRIDMSILYANVEVVMEKIRQLMNTKRENTGEFDTLILDFEGVNFLDYSCIEEFEHLLNELQAKNIGVAFIRAKRQQVDMLRKAFLDSYKIRFLHSIEELKTWKGINL